MDEYPSPTLEAAQESVEPGHDAGRIRSHISFLVAGEAISKALRFGAAIVFARALSVSDYGLLNVGVAVAGIALIATTLGLPDQGARDVAVKRDRVGWIAGRVLSARLAATGAVCVLGIAIVAVIDLDSTPFAAVTAALALCMAASADWLLRGLERMRQLATVTALGGAVVFGASLLIAAGASELLPALAVLVIGEATVAAGCWLAAGRKAAPRIGLTGVSEMLRRSWPLALSALALYLYVANLDTIILAASRSTDEAGLYSAAYRVFLAANTVSLFAAFAFLPVLATGLEQGRGPQVVSTLRGSLRYLLAYGTAATGAALLTAEPVLGSLFGSEFGEMADVLVVLSVALAWYVVGYPTGYTLIARERNTQLLAGAGLAAVLNLVLNLALIPPYGAMGAAAATAAAFAAASMAWARLHRELFGPLLPPLVGLSALSVAAVAALTVDPLRTPVAIGILALAAAISAAGLSRARSGST
jgi:O-antigen/teichoic acid export membrane protein